MWISKAVLVAWILLHFLEVDVCESKDSSVALLPNGGVSSGRNRHMIQSNNGGNRKVRCNKRSCSKKNGGNKLTKERKRKRKALCKRTFVRCKLKKFGQCKNKRCIKRNLKKCKKAYRKCKKDSNRRPNPDHQGKSSSTIAKNRLPHIGNGSSTTVSVKIEANEICKTTSDCAEGLCCAKHGHVRICKSYIILGQICPRPYKRKRSPDMYEQCPCQAGLSCSKSQSRHHTCQLMHT